MPVWDLVACSHGENPWQLYLRWAKVSHRMGGDFMTFHLHCKGEFHKHKYIGGPKRTPVKPKEDNPKKHQFVTLKDINEEKTGKMNKSRKKTDKVSKAVVTKREAEYELMGMAEYMKRFEIPNMNTNLGEGAGEVQ
ncbi:hypothetical protein AgCh_005272 [Apium graveolens]